jgi:glycosyltransferase involved in cell wall biosynthesis
MQTLTQILFSGLGGHANVAFNLIEAQEKGSIQNQLIFFGIEPLPEAYKNYCKQHNISYKVILKKQGLDLQSWIQVYRALKDFRAKKLIMHQPMLIIVLWFYKLFNKANFVQVEHNSNQVKTKQDWLYTALGFFLAPQVICLTNSYQKELSKFWFFRKEKAVIIPNGINTEIFLPTRNKNHLITLSMIGRFTPTKKFDDAIKAFHLVQQKHPNTQLILAGNGTDWEHSKVLATSLQLNSKVRFPGMLNETELLALLQKTDIYVHASTGETLSTAIIQAMSCGLPIIGSNIPGIAQMINEGENGLLVDTYNIEVFAQKIIGLVENGDLRNKLGSNARKIAVEKYSAKSMLNAYLRALK